MANYGQLWSNPGFADAAVLSMLDATTDHGRQRRPNAATKSSSPELTPPPPVTPAPPSVPASRAASTRPPKEKIRVPVGGRDLGLVKANNAKSSASGKKKTLTAVDRFNDMRETESERLVVKRKMIHDQEMNRLEIKRMKYELKLQQARNESVRLSRTHRLPSHSPRQSPRRHRRTIDLNSPGVLSASPPHAASFSRTAVAGPSRSRASIPTPSSPQAASPTTMSALTMYPSAPGALPRMALYGGDGMPLPQLPGFGVDWNAGSGSTTDNSWAAMQWNFPGASTYSGPSSDAG
ncbi:hypothetical protein B0H11DRAFT_2226440 [Mycena galericulata]|nr:hypothetical protein B0H11DRAFT_2226440 [Mycena galericulata]